MLKHLLIALILLIIVVVNINVDADVKPMRLDLINSSASLNDQQLNLSLAINNRANTNIKAEVKITLLDAYNDV